MIADDDPVVLAVLRSALREDFELVSIAIDSEQAVALAEASQPDVALVDVEMPKGGGLSAIEGIRKVAPKTAIVVLSNDESDAVVRELIGAGAVAYQRKGVEPGQLIQVMADSIAAHANGELVHD
jgi:DNA-binding NarL/FixJ family response regulator